MIPANVKLSASEASLVCDANFILTKNRIIEKVYQLFSIVNEELRHHLQSKQAILPHEIYSSAPKIYRGEKYKELPYVMLDYPRCFARNNIFAVRCFFWWGNHFSITLHLAGKYVEEYAETVLHNIFKKKDATLFICINEDQWEHHFEPGNFIPMINCSHLTAIEFIHQKKFLKIAKRLPLELWDDSFSFFTETNKEIFDLFHRDV